MTHAQFSETQVANIKQQFNALDSDQDGAITQSEFLLALKNANRTPEEYDAPQFFAHADQDKDGKITFPEFLEACQQLGLAGPRSSSQSGAKDDKEIDAIFREFDKDGDGFITANELGQVLSRQGEQLTPEQLKEMIKAADLNGDDKIDRDEFARMV